MTTFFFFFWLCWVFVSVRGLSLVVASGGHSSLWCAGFSLSQPLFVAEHRLQTRRLSSCGSRAQLLRGMWDLPRPGLEPVFPALAGRFSTTAPPGKPPCFTVFRYKICTSSVKFVPKHLFSFWCCCEWNFLNFIFGLFIALHETLFDGHSQPFHVKY